MCETIVARLLGANRRGRWLRACSRDSDSIKPPHGPSRRATGWRLTRTRRLPNRTPSEASGLSICRPDQEPSGGRGWLAARRRGRVGSGGSCRRIPALDETIGRQPEGISQKVSHNLREPDSNINVSTAASYSKLACQRTLASLLPPRAAAAAGPQIGKSLFRADLFTSTGCRMVLCHSVRHEDYARDSRALRYLFAGRVHVAQ